MSQWPGNPHLDPNGETLIIDSPVDQPPRIKPSRWRWIIDRNPCFLFSGMFMFAGCFAISQVIHAIDPSDPNALRLLLGLIVTINLYEGAVIALGLLLARSALLVRDARHLLGLAMLLLIDVTFVYNETATASLGIGALIASVAGLLAITKALAITRLLGVRLSIPATALISLDLAVLYLMPVVLRAIAHDGFIPPAAFLGVWSVLGLLLSLHAIPRSWAVLADAWGQDYRQLQIMIRGCVVILPVISLIAHASVAAWIYGIAFEPVMLSPILLALAFITARQLRLAGRPVLAIRTAGACAVAGLVASAHVPDSLIYTAHWLNEAHLSPWRGVLLITMLMFFGMWWHDRDRWWLLGNSVLMIASAWMGHTPGAILDRTVDMSSKVWITSRGLIPSSQLEWGVAGIGAAFFLLATGAGMSLCRHRQGNPHAEGLNPEP